MNDAAHLPRRWVIIGAGAVGGVVAAGLARSGQRVQVVARGEHYAAIARHGLTLQTPQEQITVPVPVAASPAEAGLREGDIVLLATKSQDTTAALADLRASAPPALAVVCVQNGVENERAALRLFDTVYGALVLAPTAHLRPGVVQAFGIDCAGVVDIGRYPHGDDERCVAVAAALQAAGLSSRVHPDVMALKRAKLLSNLGNATEVVCGPGAAVGEIVDRARAEGAAALAAAGAGVDDAARTYLRERWIWRVGEIDGQRRGGGSTWQSVARGAAQVETDFLNGEIVLLGRLTGVPTPVNERLQALLAARVRDGGAPEPMTPGQVLAGT